jgi:hypothetical protein
MNSKFNARLVFAPAFFFTLFLALAGQPALADSTFTDTTFNLSNYSIVTYNNNPSSLTISVSQNPTAGSPTGPALEIDESNSGSAALGVTGLLNSSWYYNPSTQGAIQSIDFSTDMEITSPSVSGVLSGVTAPALLYQNGNYYIDPIEVSGFTTNAYQTITGSDLQASNFWLCDFTTGTYNMASNPNFSLSGGIIELGFANLVSFPAETASATVYVDRVSWDVVSTPEPGSLVLLGAGLCALALAARKLQNA